MIDKSKDLSGRPALDALPSRSTTADSTSLLLDLSGDKAAAMRWAKEQLPASTIRAIDKAELKWGSPLESRARLRAMNPDAFAIFTSDLEAQSARRTLFVFAAACGARRVIIGDRNGRVIVRSRSGALAIEGARLAFELAASYLVILPLSWLLTVLLDLALYFRGPVRASLSGGRGAKRKPGSGLSALFARATLVANTVGKAASAGGMASHIAGFTRGAFGLGHRLTFLSSGEIPTRDKAKAIIIKHSTAIAPTRAIFELSNNLSFTFKAVSRLFEEGYGDIDFIYQRYSRFNWTGVVLSLLTGLPLALEFNGSEVWMGRHWDPVGHIGLLRRFEKLNLRAADLVFVVSEVQKRELMKDRADGRRIIVNPNGVDTAEFRPHCGGEEVRRALGLEDKIVVGFIGTFGPWHGAPVLAEAAGRVVDPSRVHFLFMGDGDQRLAVERIINESPNKIGATFTGRIAHREVPAYLDVCDILASPHVQPPDGSEFFGSPTKLFEYMAMARAIVASRLGQIAHAIADGENGLLVEPGDADELARAIDRLAGDEALRARLGAAARRTVNEHYTWRRNAARVFDEFKNERFIEKS